MPAAASILGVLQGSCQRKQPWQLRPHAKYPTHRVGKRYLHFAKLLTRHIGWTELCRKAFRVGGGQTAERALLPALQVHGLQVHGLPVNYCLLA